MSARADELLQTAVSARVVPGAAALIADRDGVRHQAVAGRLTVEGDAEVGPDTTFRIASMTKAVTTVAALQLVEDGRLGLDQPVADAVPAFGELQVLEGFSGDEPVLRRPATQATVRQLMTHTAGLGYRFLNGDLARYMEIAGVPDLFSGERAILDLPLASDPGTRWEYGLSTDWLGQVVEAGAGATLDEVFAERILGPLGMTETTFAPSEDQRSRLMRIHARTPDGGLVPIELELPTGPDFWAGGHGLYSTAGDYVRFLRALLRDGELDGARILSPETVELMFTPQIGELVLPDVIRTSDPTLSNDIPALPFRQTWGLGLHVVLEDVPGMRRAGTGDWAGLCNSYYWVDRASGVAGAFFTQVLPFFDQAIIELLMALEQETYAAHGAAAAP